MSVMTAKLSAILLLSAQILPLGLPLVCEQVMQPASHCEQPTAPVGAVTLDADPVTPSCMESALCPTHVTAVPALAATRLVLTSDGPLAGAVPEILTPLASQSPLLPPPKA
jgi:hypothetical protein